MVSWVHAPRRGGGAGSSPAKETKSDEMQTIPDVVIEKLAQDFNKEEGKDMYSFIQGIKCALRYLKVREERQERIMLLKENKKNWDMGLIDKDEYYDQINRLSNYH